MRLIDAYALADKVRESMTDNPHKDGKVKANHRFEHEHFLWMICNASTVNPEDLRPKGKWDQGVCTNCGFDVGCLTDGENYLEQWVWDEGFDYCPNCGAKMEG